MPQPTVLQVHVQAALTQIATAYIQDQRAYVADQVFPTVPVEFQADKYFVFSKDDFFRDEAVRRADATESAGGGLNLSTGTYAAEVNGDPFTDVANAQTLILQTTGFEANTLLISYPVYQSLRKHPLVIDRIKYTTRADASKITPELLASAFDVERVIVSKAVYNSTAETTTVTGSVGTYNFVASKDALLCHSAPSPGIMIPTAGYIFAWSGLTGLNTIGIRIAQIPMPWLGLETVRTEGEMAFDMQVIGKDLGIHFSGIVQ